MYPFDRKDMWPRKSGMRSALFKEMVGIMCEQEEVTANIIIRQSVAQ